jgi:hypothetical protein
MKKVSLFVAIILSCLLPGAGLLLISKGGWFAAYFIAALIGGFLLFFMGLGIFVLTPVWIVSFIHTIVAVMKNNRLAIAA